MENKAEFALSHLGDLELEVLNDAGSLGFEELLKNDRINFAFKVDSTGVEYHCLNVQQRPMY